MRLLRPVPFLLLIGVYSYPQLSFSADYGGTHAKQCRDEYCGESGAGTCIDADPGYICRCSLGFTAYLLPSGAACVRNEDTPEGREPGDSTYEGSGWTAEGEPTHEGGEAGWFPPVTTPESGDYPQGSFGGSDWVPPVTTPENGDYSPESSGYSESPSGEATVVQPIDVGETTGACAGYPCGAPGSGKCLFTEEGYACVCSPGFAAVYLNGRQMCASGADAVCADDPCQPGHHCVPLGGTYTCICAPGYHSTIQGGDANPTCVADIEGGVCNGNACGPQEGVRGCAIGLDGERECTCNSGFTVRAAADGGPECAQETAGPSAGGLIPSPGTSSTDQEAAETMPQTAPSATLPEGGGTAGSETGEAQGVESEPGGGVPGEGVVPPGMEWEGGLPGGAEGATGVEEEAAADTVGGEGGETAGGGAAGQEAGSAPGGTGRDEDTHKEEGGGNGAFIAGGVIGAVLLVAAAGGGAVMYSQKQGAGESAPGEEAEFEQPISEGVEVEADESEILINVSNSDWAS